MLIRFHPIPGQHGLAILIDYQPQTESAGFRRLERVLEPLGWLTTEQDGRPEDLQVHARLTRAGGGPAGVWTPTEAEAWIPEARRMIRTVGYLAHLPVTRPSVPPPVPRPTPRPAPHPTPSARPLTVPAPDPPFTQRPAPRREAITLPRDPAARIKARFAPRIELHRTGEPPRTGVTGPVMVVARTGTES
jgi:hypothetical protein